MLEGADYNIISEPVVGADGGTLVIEFTTTGIEKLTAGNNLKIYFETSINETAVVGVPMPNNVTVDYTNGQADHWAADLRRVELDWRLPDRRSAGCTGSRRASVAARDESASAQLDAVEEATRAAEGRSGCR